MELKHYTFTSVGGKWVVDKFGMLKPYPNDTGARLNVFFEHGKPVLCGEDGATLDVGAVWAVDDLALKQPVEETSPAGAKKYDQDKPMMDLLLDGCPNALLAVGEVLTYGYRKYGGKHGWKALPDAQKRYEAALLRHQIAQATGEVNDPESGLKHAAHIACNALFLLQLQMENDNATEKSNP